MRILLRHRLITLLDALVPGVMATLRRVKFGVLGQATAVSDEDYLAVLHRLANRPVRTPPAGTAPGIDFLLPLASSQGCEAIISTVTSLQRQTATTWRLLIAGGSEAQHRRIKARCGAGDERIRFVAGKVSENSSAALFKAACGAADGDFVATLRPGDVLESGALAWLLDQLHRLGATVLIYCDHLEYWSRSKRSRPHFKPAWDPVRLRQDNYIGSFFVVRRQFLAAVLADVDLDHAGDLHHALLRRLASVLEPEWCLHAPMVLLSQAGRRRPAVVTYSTAEAAAHSALLRQSLSIIVPTRDGLPHLQACINGVLRELRGTSMDAEILVIDNDSQTPACRRYLAQIAGQAPIRVLSYPRPFNYSAINNWAVNQSRGDLLLLLNDDVEPMRAGWLRRMIGSLALPGAGVVGARLLYPDGRIQHAGVVIGLEGVAGHACRGLFPYAPAARALGAQVRRSVSAVTGACLLTYKALYREVGGLDAKALAVAFNDVDYCLKVARLGFGVVYDPRATLLHHESVSRGADDTPVRRKRFAAEVQTMLERWSTDRWMDPFYSPHWSLQSAQMRLGLPDAGKICRLRSASSSGCKDFVRR